MSKRRPAQSEPPVDANETEPAAVETVPRTGSLTRELTRVEEINFQFYEAFHKRDLNLMGAVWSRSPYARCVHPGWEPVVGWPYIRQSWEEIFSSMTSIEFELEDVHVEVVGETAWINLVANAEVTTEEEEEFATAVVATTIMEKLEGQWLIVLHHSSHYVEDDELEEAEHDHDMNHGFGGTNGGGQPN